MRCARSPFIITNDVRSLNQSVGPHQQGRRTNDLFYPDEPAEDQLRVELVTPGSKRSAPFTRELSAYESAQHKKQKRRQRDPHVGDPVHGVGDHNGGWRVPNNGKWKQKRNGNQIIRVPLADWDGSQSRTELSPVESRGGTPYVADGVVRSSVRATDQALCDGPDIAAKLRRIIGTLTVHRKR